MKQYASTVDNVTSVFLLEGHQSLIVKGSQKQTTPMFDPPKGRRAPHVSFFFFYND